MTDAEFLLKVLRDGRWHGLNEILGRSQADRGFGLTVHSRAADLRKRGLTVEQENRPGPNGRVASFYRLLSAAESSGQTAGSPVSAALSELASSNPDDGDAHRDGDNQLALSIPRSEADHFGSDRGRSLVSKARAA